MQHAMLRMHTSTKHPPTRPLPCSRWRMSGATSDRAQSQHVSVNCCTHLASSCLQILMLILIVHCCCCQLDTCSYVAPNLHSCIKRHFFSSKQCKPRCALLSNNALTSGGKHPCYTCTHLSMFFLDSTNHVTLVLTCPRCWPTKRYAASLCMPSYVAPH